MQINNHKKCHLIFITFRLDNKYLDKNNKISSDLFLNEKIINIDISDFHILFLSEKGKVFGLGSNDNNQLARDGCGDFKCIVKLNIDYISSKIVNVFVTDHSSFLLTENGELYSCGYAINGLKKDCYKLNIFTKIKENVINVYNGQLLNTFNTNEIKELECGAYNSIIITNNQKIFVSGDFKEFSYPQFHKTFLDFTEIDLKPFTSHDVFLKQQDNLKVRTGINYVVFFTQFTSKTIIDIFNFNSSWKLYDISMITLS
ncbi:hypothetical protein ABK040_016618 [Willaertia magna]